MRQLLLFIVISCSCVLTSSQNAVAGAKGYFQSVQKDSVPSRVLEKVTITVRDLADGNTIDSAMVNVGAKSGFTNAHGYVQFDSVVKGSLITASKGGYLLSSKKANAVVTVRLAKRESSSIPHYNNGLYSRPVEHSSGAYTVVSGAELRKVNSLDFVEALKVFAPSFIVSRNNNYGDDPNVPLSARIRGAYGFPVSATIANQSGGGIATVQLNPSASDFVANNIANPDQPVILLDGVQVALQTALDMDINRIDKVTILEDAAATSQYGVRGGNGVLLIQTKRPLPGRFSVTYSGQVQLNTPDLSSYKQENNGGGTDWLSIPTRNGIGTKHFISLEGGDDDISYGLDFSYNSIQGVMKGSGRKNTNLGGYINTRIKTVNVSNYISYTASTATNSPYGSLAEYAWLDPAWNPYDSIKGGFAKKLAEYTYQGNVIRVYNPAYNGTLSTTSNRIYSRLSDLLSANLNIGHGFKLNGRLSFIKQSDEENVFLPPGHTTFASYAPDEFFKRGTYDQTSSEFHSLEGALNLDYTKRIGLHQLYASAGMLAMETNSESAGIQLAGFISDKLTDIAFGKAYSNSRPETGIIKTRLASAYGNFTYSYDNRYQLEITGNADQSSQFGKNHPTVPHWSVGAGWNLHQERFFRENKIVTALRIRGNAGTAGNLFYQSYLGHTRFNYYTDRQYVQGGAVRGIGLGAFLAGLANDDLVSPVMEKQNIGMDAVLLQNRLFITVDAYRNKTKNIVLPVISPASTGLLNFNYYDNIGAIESKGVEFNVNYRVINNTPKGIVWSLMVNGIHNEDHVQAVSDHFVTLNSANDAPGVDQTRPQPRYVAGQSLTGIWAVRSLGIDPATGKEKYLAADGSETFTWNAADKILAGDLSPKWQGSIGTTLSVKNISTGLYFNYEFGGSYYNHTAGGSSLISTRFVAQHNLMNCAALTLNYSLPESILSKVRAKTAKLGFIANNAFQTSTMKATKGIYYPFQRSYTFSITTSF